jgi:hypothetical protein
MLCGKARFEPRTLGTKAERYDHCATRPVVLCTWYIPNHWRQYTGKHILDLTRSQCPNRDRFSSSWPTQSLRCLRGAETRIGLAASGLPVGVARLRLRLIRVGHDHDDGNLN